MKRTILFLFLMLTALLWGETVINGSRSILGAWNAGGAASTIPAKVGTAAPAVCAVGEQFFDSDAAAGSNILLCTAPNTWTAVSGGGGGGGSEQACTPGDLRYFCVQEEFVLGSATNAQLGALGWQTGGNGTTAGVMTTHPNPGSVRLTSGATSGQTQWISLIGSMLGDWYAAGSRVNEVKFVARLNSHTDSNFRIVVGQLNVTTGVVSNGFGVGKGGNGNFHLFWGSSGEQASTLDLGVAVDSNWHTYRFYADGTANKMYVQIDEGTPRTVCPTGGGCDLSVNAPFAQTTYTLAASVITSTSSARSLDVDYVSARATVGANPGRRN